MPQNYIQAVQQPGQTVNPLFAFLGLKIIVIKPGECELAMPFQAGFTQGGGVVAGGVLATLLDEAMAHAALALTASEGRGKVATISMDTRFFAPARPESNLTARSRVVRGGKRVLFVEAEAFVGDTCVAKASGQFMVLG